MKRTMNWALLLLVVVMSLALVACGGGNNNNNNNQTNETTAPIVTGDPHTHCVCGGDANGMPEHTCADVDWTPWTGLSNVTDGGHYYLTADINGDFMNWAEGNKNFSLCLNGHNVTENDKMTIRGNITICDCAETDGTITSLYNNTEDGEGAIGHIYNDSTLTIYGGNYKPGEGCATSSAAGWYVVETGTLTVYNGNLYGGYAMKNGGNIYLENNCELYMYGGALIQSGELKHSARGSNIYSDGGDVYLLGDILITGGIADHGGNIYMHAGEFQMTGGLITAGKTSGTSGNGGNVYTKTTFEFTGGEITNGLASRGGNVFLHSNGALEISGTAKIADGSAIGGRDPGKNVGGNLYVYESGTSYLEMTGGEIIGGTADCGTNIFISGSGCQVAFKGGKVSGGTVRMDDEVGGGAVVFDGGAVEATIEMGRGAWTLKKNTAPMTIQVLNDITPNTLRLNMKDAAADCADVTLELKKAAANELVFYTDVATAPACIKAPAGYTLATEATNSATTFKLLLKQ